MTMNRIGLRPRSTILGEMREMPDDNGKKCDDQRIGNRALREEQKHDECHRQHDLYARVKTVHRTVARKKLTEGNILQHS